MKHHCVANIVKYEFGGTGHMGSLLGCWSLLVCARSQACIPVQSRMSKTRWYDHRNDFTEPLMNPIILDACLTFRCTQRLLARSFIQNAAWHQFLPSNAMPETSVLSNVEPTSWAKAPGKCRCKIRWQTKLNKLAQTTMHAGQDEAAVVACMFSFLPPCLAISCVFLPQLISIRYCLCQRNCDNMLWWHKWTFKSYARCDKSSQQARLRQNNLLLAQALSGIDRNSCDCTAFYRA